MQTMLTVVTQNTPTTTRSALSDPAGSDWGGSEALTRVARRLGGTARSRFA